MSVRENIELSGLQAKEQYVEILIDEFGATLHPRQADAYVLASLPFHTPRRSEDHNSILGFHNIPLPDPLLKALVDYPGSFRDDILICWTREQDLIFEATLGQLRGHATKP